jgi:hypothetical protein
MRMFDTLLIEDIDNLNSSVVSVIIRVKMKLNLLRDYFLDYNVIGYALQS